jgi:peptide-methionine (S)-S-oxide reductase
MMQTSRYGLGAVVVPSVALMLATAATPDRSPPRRTVTAASQTAVFAAGCYWTVEAVFEHVRGVLDVTSGMAGHKLTRDRYVLSASGTTGPAEAVRVTWDPARTSYAELLRVFFEAAHDPTQVDRQGPDVGGRYRSVVFYANDEQRDAALAAITRLGQSKAFARPLATQVAPLDSFRPVPEDQQDFVKKNPEHPYVTQWDHPRLERFRRTLPALFRER